MKEFIYAVNFSSNMIQMNINKVFILELKKYNIRILIGRIINPIRLL